MAHTFNTSTREAEAGGSQSSRSVWSREGVGGGREVGKGKGREKRIKKNKIDKIVATRERP